ncbi:hypothetical protein HDU67_007026 [Dinochytrium kinnereticum]|nr:hypothetical protein HDU67_007026 [Dinochytrium kinnereticum]
MLSTVTTAQIPAAGVGEGTPPSPPARTIIIAVDGSKSSHNALAWTLDHVVRPSDRIILSTIAVAPSATWGDMMQFWEKGHSYGLEKAAEMEERAREFATKTLTESSEIIKSRNLPTTKAFLITHEVISVPHTFKTAPLPSSEPTTPPEETHTRRHPAQLIADLCSSHKADMLVIGDHDHPALSEHEAEEEPLKGFRSITLAVAGWIGNWRKRTSPSLQEALTGIAPCPVIIVRGEVKREVEEWKDAKEEVEEGKEVGGGGGGSEEMREEEVEEGKEVEVGRGGSEEMREQEEWRGGMRRYDAVTEESKEAWSSSSTIGESVEGFENSENGTPPG